MLKKFHKLNVKYIFKINKFVNDVNEILIVLRNLK